MPITNSELSVGALAHLSHSKPVCKAAAWRPIALSVAAALVLAGCSTTMSPFTLADNQARAGSMMVDLYADVEPISGSLTLYDAIARALKYNLDARVKRLEVILATDRIDLAGMEDLPRLTSEAGYATRSNLNASSSADAKTGARSAATSTSQDQERGTASLRAVWNVLDLGVSYYKTRQASNRTLVAAEQMRSLEASIVQDVRSAFWRAIAAQRSLNQIAHLSTRANRALKNSQQIQSLELADPVAALRYQRDLTDTRRRLTEQTRALQVAQIELATLIRVKPGTQLALKAPKGMRVPDGIWKNVSTLEFMALSQHPQLRAEDYQLRIIADESHKAVFEMLPRVNLEGASRYDSNSFQVNNSWADYGAVVSWDIFQLLRAPARFKEIDAQETLQHGRKLALGMAAIAKVHIALAQYSNDAVSYRTAVRLAQLDQQIAEQIGARVKEESASELEAIKADLDVVLSQLQKDLSFGKMQESAGQIMVSVGADFVPSHARTQDLGTLANDVIDAEAHWYAVGKAI